MPGANPYNDAQSTELHTLPERDSHLQGDEVGEGDCTTNVMKSCLWCGGCLATLLCLPFAMCGCGPIVTVKEGHRAAVLEYGKFVRIASPGTYHFNPLTQEFVVRSIQVQTLDVHRQDMLTRDNVPVKVNAIVYYRIFNLERSIFSVQNAATAISNLAQSTLRTIIGENKLDEIFSRREEINARLKEIVDKDSDEWGLQVTNVEVKDISIPPDMQRIMASVAEAEREGAAKIILAKAEHRAANTLTDAADIMATNPISVQLRYFHTLTEISAEKNSTVIVPESVTGMFANILKNGGAGGSDWNYKDAQKVRQEIRDLEEERMEQEQALLQEPLIPIRKKKGKNDVSDDYESS